MNKQKITAIIVVYNKKIEDISFCFRIKKYVNIIVVDNSTKKNENEEFCFNNSIQYISMHGNKGLSKAYNTALDSVNDSEAVILLDDDTEVPDEYFLALQKALIDKPDVDIFVPIIRGQDGVIYSPNNYHFLKNKLVINPQNDVVQARFNAISSCMAIRMHVFKNYRYNETLFVDEVDHCFCREQRNKGRKFAVINVEIVQCFHQRTKNIIPSSAWKRERIRIIDIFRHARLIGGRKYVFLAYIKSCGIGVQIGIKSKSISVMMNIFLLSGKLFFKPF